MFPLVRELAVDGIPVTVTCRVLTLCRAQYYRWLSEPSPTVSPRRPASPTRSSTPTEMTPSSGIGSWPTRSALVIIQTWRIGSCGGSAATTRGGRCSGSPSVTRDRSPGLQRTTTSWVRPSPPTRRTSCGWPTSPSTGPTRASSTAARSTRRCSNAGHGRSLDGWPWTTRCVRWSSATSTSTGAPNRSPASCVSTTDT